MPGQIFCQGQDKLRQWSSVTQFYWLLFARGVWIYSNEESGL